MRSSPVSGSVTSVSCHRPVKLKVPPGSSLFSGTRSESSADVARRIEPVARRAHGYEVHDVIDEMPEQAQPHRGFAGEAEIALHFGRPGRLRAQIGIAALDDAVGELRGGHEVFEIELTHVAIHAHLQLVLAELARELHPRLHVGERHGLVGVAAEGKARSLGGQTRI
jgi:hypothetical protein